MVCATLQRHQNIVVVIEIGVSHNAGRRNRIDRLNSGIVAGRHSGNAGRDVNAISWNVAVEIEVSGEARTLAAVVDLVLGAVKLNRFLSTPVIGRQRPVAARRSAIASDLPSAGQAVESAAHIGAELLAASNRQIVEVVPSDAMLGNIRVALIAVEAQPRGSVGGHRARQEDLRLIVLIGCETSALRRHVARGRRVAHQIEELESHALAEAPFHFELHSRVVRVPELGVDGDVAKGGLIDGAAGGVRVEPGRQRPSGGRVPDVIADWVGVITLHALIVPSGRADKSGAEHRVLHNLAFQRHVPLMGCRSRQIARQGDLPDSRQNHGRLRDAQFRQIGRVYARNHRGGRAQEVIRKTVRRIRGVVPIERIGTLQGSVSAHAIERSSRNREMVQAIAAAQHKRPAREIAVPSEPGPRPQVVLADADQVVWEPYFIGRHPLHADRRVAIDNRLRRVAGRDQLRYRHVAHNALTREIEQGCYAGVIQIRPQILPPHAQIHGQAGTDFPVILNVTRNVLALHVVGPGRPLLRIPSGNAEEEVSPVVAGLREASKRRARRRAIDRRGVAPKIEVGLVGPVGNRIQHFLPVPASKLHLMTPEDLGVVLFAANDLRVLRTRNDAVELHALVADVQKVRGSVHIERVRRAELRGYVLGCALLIQAVQPVDGGASHYGLRKQCGRESMCPGQSLGIGAFEVGFTVPEVVRRNGITRSVEGPAVYLIPLAARIAGEDLIFVCQAMIGAKGDGPLA